MLPGNDITCELLDVVSQASGKADFISEMHDILSQAQLEVEALNPQCSACGDCCKFDTAGHRLFASTGEFVLLEGLKPDVHQAYLRCPWQVDGKCHARENRPLGCRMFFCDKNLSHQLHEIYEKYHACIVELHRKWGIGYYYCEMTTVAWEMCLKSVKRA